MSSVQSILKKYQSKPSKRLGQNFLIDKFALAKVVAAAQVKPADLVLEIGPGTGVLTRELAKRVKKVIAIEKDSKMVEALKETLQGFKNIEVVHGDILRLETKFLSGLAGYKMVGNLPFYLTMPVIRKFLECNVARPRYMVFIVQKEVAQRVCAKPPKMNLLAVSVQFYAEPKIVSYISKKSFWPRPKVDGAIIRIVPQINADSEQISADLFFKVVRSGFSHPRKQLVNNLASVLKLKKDDATAWLLQNNIKPEQRAQTLTIENWTSLAKSATMY